MDKNGSCLTQKKHENKHKVHNLLKKTLQNIMHQLFTHQVIFYDLKFDAKIHLHFRAFSEA